jgi:hypothetical protein
MACHSAGSTNRAGEGFVGHVDPALTSHSRAKRPPAFMGGRLLSAKRELMLATHRIPKPMTFYPA